MAELVEGDAARSPHRGPKRLDVVHLSDVAKLAGVSTSTASRALAGSPLVSERTRRRVRKAAEELHYTVNTLSKSLMGSGPRPLVFITFGLILPHVEMVNGMSRVANEHGTTLLTSFVRHSDDYEERIITLHAQQRVRGVILGRSGDNSPQYVRRIRSYQQQLQAINASLVLCARPEIPELPEIPSVNYDQTVVVKDAVGTLVSLGHRRIAFIGDAIHLSARQRVEGYRNGMRDAGLEAPAHMVVRCDNTKDAGYEAAMTLFRDLAGDPAPRPTAVIAYSDFVALGVYRAARELGLSLPRDLSVIGFDDDPYAEDFTPSLSSIHVPFESIGKYAARMAFAPRDSYADNPHVTLSSKLVIRDSVAPPAQ